jgi:hypothetical protein
MVHLATGSFVWLSPIPAELDVVIDQMQFLDIAVRGLGFDSLDCPVDQCISCLAFSRTAYNCQKIHIVKYFHWVEGFEIVN